MTKTGISFEVNVWLPSTLLLESWFYMKHSFVLWSNSFPFMHFHYIRKSKKKEKKYIVINFNLSDILTFACQLAIYIKLPLKASWNFRFIHRIKKYTQMLVQVLQSPATVVMLMLPIATLQKRLVAISFR